MPFLFLGGGWGGWSKHCLFRTYFFRSSVITLGSVLKDHWKCWMMKPGPTTCKASPLPSLHLSSLLSLFFDGREWGYVWLFFSSSVHLLNNLRTAPGCIFIVFYHQSLCTVEYRFKCSGKGTWTAFKNCTLFIQWFVFIKFFKSMCLTFTIAEKSFLCNFV